jgi:hypothetical protein
MRRRGARGGDGDTEACRMANNAKGRTEMKGFKQLGFTLEFNGKDIERGVELYEKSGLDRKSVKEYGLQESDKDLWRGRTKVAGKKLLYIHKEALRQVFGDASIHSYQDLWKVGGVVERSARRADNIARSSALQHLRESLSIRKGQAQESWHADTGHQQMRDEMEECIGRIEMMVREDRQKQSLKEGKTHTACGAGSNASQKSKGTGMAMPLLFLAPAMMAAASRKTSNVGMGSWLANYSMSYHELKIPSAAHHLYAHRGSCTLPRISSSPPSCGWRVSERRHIHHIFWKR